MKIRYTITVDVESKIDNLDDIMQDTACDIEILGEKLAAVQYIMYSHNVTIGAISEVTNEE